MSWKVSTGVATSSRNFLQQCKGLNSLKFLIGLPQFSRVTGFFANKIYQAGRWR